MIQNQRAWLGAGGKWSTFVIWAKNTFTLGRSDYQRQYEPILYGWKQGSDHFWCGARDQGDVWFVDKPRVNDLHPTMKPVELVERAIRNSSKNRDIVLDLLGGSGTTLVAAERTGRSARLMELDPAYVDVIIERWQDFSVCSKARIEPSRTSGERGLPHARRMPPDAVAIDVKAPAPEFCRICVVPPSSWSNSAVIDNPTKTGLRGLAQMDFGTWRGSVGAMTGRMQCQQSLPITTLQKTQHWLTSPKRDELFGPLGVTNIRTFVDPQNPTRVAVLMDVPDMDALQTAMQSKAAADAMDFDGVVPESLVILVES